MTSSPSSTPSGGTKFTIRWGRLAIFATGAIALVLAVITGIAAVFGAATWLIAAISLGITALSYAALRGLAILDSKRRARERELLSISEGLQTTFAPPVPEPAQAEKPLSSNDEVFDVADQPEAQQELIEDETEEPVDDAPAPVPARQPLPRPMYLDVPEVARETPEPLHTPKDPAPSGQVHLSDGVSSQYQEKISDKANTRLDLDKVLNRRRAI